eukprot:scaffold11.g3865.t1
MAVAFSTPFVVLSSMLSTWTALYGRGALLSLSLAYYLPSLPLLAAQLLLDGHYDGRYGLVRSHTVRSIAGYGGAAALLTAVPFLALDSPRLLLLVAAPGIGDTAALALGSVAGSPLVLVAEAALRLGPRAALQPMTALFALMAGVCLGGLGGTWVVLRELRRAEAEGGAGEGSSAAEQGRALGGGAGAVEGLASGGSGLEQRLLEAEGGPDGAAAAAAGGSLGAEGVWGEGGLRVPGTAGAEEEPTDARRASLWPAWPAAAALALSVGASQLLFPFIPFARSAPGGLGPLLPQARVLFWSRCLCDAGARLLARATPLESSCSLLALACARAALAPLGIAYVALRLPQSDAAAVAYVALQWLLSGYVNACCLMLGPRLVAGSLARPAASAMSLVFQCACVAGLLAALPLQALPA